MDFMSYKFLDGNVVIEGIKNFELNHIFENGQCFRWQRTAINTYIIIAKGRVIELERKNNELIIYNSSMEDFENIWIDYFDLNRDYDEIKRSLNTDRYLKESMEFGYGLRLLNQDAFEMLISFIISSNNRIPMIKKVISLICERYGKEVIYKGNKYYLFPELEDLKDLTEEDFRACSSGFRGRYIYNTIQMINEKNNIEYIKSLDDNSCHKELQQFSGVGSKVSDCIMLFSMNKYSAFPVDVWVKRAMMKFYVAPDLTLSKIREFGRDKFKDLSGFAQQYLFYYVRENNIKV